MLIRLILAIVIALAGVPCAASSCVALVQAHDAATMSAMANHEAPASPDQHQAGHDDHQCPGCVPPAMLRAPSITLPLLIPDLPRQLTGSTLQLGHSLLPPLPPPRLG